MNVSIVCREADAEFPIVVLRSEITFVDTQLLLIWFSLPHFILWKHHFLIIFLSSRHHHRVFLVVSTGEKQHERHVEITSKLSLWYGWKIGWRWAQTVKRNCKSSNRLWTAHNFDAIDSLRSLITIALVSRNSSLKLFFVRWTLHKIPRRRITFILWLRETRNERIKVIFWITSNACEA